MKNRLPAIINKTNICIICEGDEEYEYLDKLNKLGVWHEHYHIVLDNADGNGNIPARYQDRYQNGAYDVILVFCDTDRKPYEQYGDIKNKINEFHGNNIAADAIVIYGNPCTMQIILLHWADVKLKSPAKKMNAPLIQEYTGIDNYKGRADQRKVLMQKITADNYKCMYLHIKNIRDDDTVVGTSNFGRFLEHFMGEDDLWIKTINDCLEKE